MELWRQIRHGNLGTPILGALKMCCSDEQAIYTDMWCNSGYSFNLLAIQTLPYGQTAQIDLRRPHWINEYPASVNLLSFYVSVSGKKKKCFPAHSLFAVTYKMRLMTINTGLRQLVWQAARDGLDSCLEGFLSVLHCLSPMHGLSNVEPPLHVHIRECTQFPLPFCFQWRTCINLA